MKNEDNSGIFDAYLIDILNKQTFNFTLKEIDSMTRSYTLRKDLLDGICLHSENLESNERVEDLTNII